MNKKLVFWIKLVLTVAVIGFIIYEVSRTAAKLRSEPFTVEIPWILASLAAFAAFMIQSALVWYWLAKKMGDRTPLVPAIGAYVFSQMGKYVPGKVALLLMRVERAKRAGMDPQICVVATLIENAMYMVSGAMIAVATLLLYARENLLLVAVISAGLLAMCAVFHPAIFYRLVNRVMVKMKRPEVPAQDRLRAHHMLIAVIGFFPCWLLGGLSLWCATRAIHLSIPPETLRLAPADYTKFPGAVALGVVGGMAFLTPGGVGPRELIQGLILVPVVGQTWAVLAVALQRLVQIACEISLGLIGSAFTRKPASIPEASATPETAPLIPTPPATPAQKPV
jgi:glycosyltransferase 2 family protein